MISILSKQKSEFVGEERDAYDDSPTNMNLDEDFAFGDAVEANEKGSEKASE